MGWRQQRVVGTVAGAHSAHLLHRRPRLVRMHAQILGEEGIRASREVGAEWAGLWLSTTSRVLFKHAHSKVYNERLDQFEYYYPFWRKALKFAVTIPVTLLFMLVVLGIGGACLTLEIYLVYQKNGETGEMGVDFGFWTFLGVASPGIIFAVLADAICTELLKVVARKMTEWEAQVLAQFRTEHYV